MPPGQGGACSVRWREHAQVIEPNLSGVIAPRGREEPGLEREQAQGVIGADDRSAQRCTGVGRQAAGDVHGKHWRGAGVDAQHGLRKIAFNCTRIAKPEQGVDHQLR